MKKSIKIIGTIGIMGILLVCAYLLGTKQTTTKTVTETKEIEKIVEIVPEGYIDTKSDEFINNYVDMRKVVYFEVIDGLQLYLEDGSGYYWE